MHWTKVNVTGSILHLWFLGAILTNLLELYVKLAGLVLVGFILGRKLPVTVPTRLGLFLFWVGVPISIVSFLRQSSLSGQPAAHTWDRVLCRAKILLEKIPFDFALMDYFGW